MIHILYQKSRRKVIFVNYVLENMIFKISGKSIRFPLQNQAQTTFLFYFTVFIQGDPKQNHRSTLIDARIKVEV